MSVMLEYARRGKNAWWRYILTAVLAVAAAIALGVAINLALLVTHVISLNTLQDIAKPSHPVAFFIGNGVLFALLLAGLAGAAWLIQKKRFSDLIGQWKWSRFATGFAVWSACSIVGVLADVVLAPGGFHWTAGAGTLGMAIAAAIGLGVQTLTEEVIFRGFVTQGLLLAVKRPIVTAVLSGLVFGSVHIPNGLPQCVNATLFGMAAALIAIRTGGVAYTWGLHLINNLFGAIVVVSGGDVFNGAPGLFTENAPGLMWWDVVVGVLLLAVPLWLTRNEGRVVDPAAALE